MNINELWEQIKGSSESEKIRILCNFIGRLEYLEETNNLDKNVVEALNGSINTILK